MKLLIISEILSLGFCPGILHDSDYTLIVLKHSLLISLIISGILIIQMIICPLGWLNSNSTEKKLFKELCGMQSPVEILVYIILSDE